MNDNLAARDPAAEAAALAGDGYGVRVLEPSPPAVAEPPFWAGDDHYGAAVGFLTGGHARLSSAS